MVHLGYERKDQVGQQDVKGHWDSGMMAQNSVSVQ